MYIPKILPLSDKFFSFSLQENQFHIFVLLLPPVSEVVERVGDYAWPGKLLAPLRAARAGAANTTSAYLTAPDARWAAGSGRRRPGGAPLP